MVVRKVWVVGVVAECELQHLHARETKVIAQPAHLWRDDAEVLNEDALMASAQLCGFKKGFSRARRPPSFLRGLTVWRDLPGCFEAAKVVDAHLINERERVMKPPRPPCETLRLVRPPVVHRVPPALPDGGKRIWRHASDNRRPTIVAKLEQFPVSPDVGAVEVHKYWDVSDQADRPRQRGVVERAPLSEEQPLDKLVIANLDRQLLLQFMPRPPASITNTGRPVRPRTIQMIAEGAERRVLVKPPPVLPLEIYNLRFPAIGIKSFESPPQKFGMSLLDILEIHSV